MDEGVSPNRSRWGRAAARLRSEPPRRDPARAASCLARALEAWVPNPERYGDAWVSLIPRIRLDDSLSGLDLFGDLVVVVGHDLERSELGEFLGAFMRAAQDYDIGETRLWAFRPATPETSGTMTLRLPELGSTADYRVLVQRLGQVAWRVGRRLA